MPARLADRLSLARTSGFAGRKPELDLLRELLTQQWAGIVYLFGPPGVGKTCLLHEYAALAAASGRRVTWLDAHELEPGTLTSAAEAADGNTFLVVDPIDHLGRPEQWLRRDLLPHLADGVIVALAGRAAPAALWRTDPGLRTLVRAVKLGNLSPDEARQVLRGRGVPEAHHQVALELTHRHPLALALLGDVVAISGGRLGASAATEVLTALVGELIETVPSPLHRAALEASAQVLVTTEPLLATALGVSDARELFDWLRGLSIMEYSARGIHPHELARDALAAELRWRHPDQHAEIHRRVREYYLARFADADPATQQRVLLDCAFLHRENPVLGPLLAHVNPGVESAPATGLGSDREWAGLRALIALHEGEASARIADHWRARQPESIQVSRGTHGSPTGLVIQLALHDTTEAQRSADPVVAAVWQHLTAHAPLRPGEQAIMVRFWLDCQVHQDVSEIQTVLMLNSVRDCLTTPRLAFHTVTYARPEVWEAANQYADMHLIAQASVGDRVFGTYGHDWRVTSPLQWLSLLADRETAATPLAVQPPSAAPRVRVLDEEEFAEAVREALRSFDRPDRLGSCTLARSRRVSTQEGDAARTVQRLIREAAAVLEASARDRSAFRALHHTYLQPAGTQALASTCP